MANEMEIRQQLDKIESWDEFFEARQLLAKWKSKEVYEVLFPLAISGLDGSAPHRAGCLLIELQPDCPESLSEVLAKIHNSKWYVSFREVPFYLVTQFGKHVVLESARKFIHSLPANQKEQSRVETLIYWASFPASALCKGFHEWEIERFYDESKKDA